MAQPILVIDHNKTLNSDDKRYYANTKASSGKEIINATQ
jgi:hypothetical protein